MAIGDHGQCVPHGMGGYIDFAKVDLASRWKDDNVHNQEIYDVADAVKKAEEKFPGQSLESLIIALGEEFGEVCQAWHSANTPNALNEGNATSIYKEASHVACVAVRIMRLFTTAD